MVKIDYGRLESISKVFSEIGLVRIKVFEEVDPQMVAAKVISKACGSITPHILFTNALISYQLGTIGEDYWLTFAKLVTESCPANYHELLDRLIELLRHQHRFAVKAKEKRLSKLRSCIHLYDSMLDNDLDFIRREIARCLGAGIDDKTIVFAIKMLYYGLRARGKELTLPHNIPIPVDRRVIKISYLSGLIVIDRLGLEHYKINEALTELFSKPQIVRDAWNIVGYRSGIPPLHIDAVLWYLGKYANIMSKIEVFKMVVEDFGIHNVDRVGLKYIKLLVDELLYRLP